MWTTTSRLSRGRLREGTAHGGSRTWGRACGGAHAGGAHAGMLRTGGTHAGMLRTGAAHAKNLRTRGTRGAAYARGRHAPGCTRGSHAREGAHTRGGTHARGHKWKNRVRRPYVREMWRRARSRKKFLRRPKPTPIMLLCVCVASDGYTRARGKTASQRRASICVDRQSPCHYQ